jgi:hypothetical protein
LLNVDFASMSLNDFTNIRLSYTRVSIVSGEISVYVYTATNNALSYLAIAFSYLFLDKYKSPNIL